MSSNMQTIEPTQAHPTPEASSSSSNDEESSDEWPDNPADILLCTCAKRVEESAHLAGREVTVSRREDAVTKREVNVQKREQALGIAPPQQHRSASDSTEVATEPDTDFEGEGEEEAPEPALPTVKKRVASPMDVEGAAGDAKKKARKSAATEEMDEVAGEKSSEEEFEGEDAGDTEDGGVNANEEASED